MYSGAGIRTANSAIVHDRFAPRILAAALVLLAACVAATVAHLVIDLAGDVLLAHDAYDNEAHASRFFALEIALAGAFAIGWNIVASALRQARRRQGCLRVAVERAVAGSAWVFVTRVIGATIGVLAVMGGLDAKLDAIPIHTIGDVFGGSCTIGVSIAIGAGAAMGAGTLAIVRWIARRHDSIVAVVIALLSRHGLAHRPAARRRRLVRVFSLLGTCGALARRAGKRAPPPRAA